MMELPGEGPGGMPRVSGTDETERARELALSQAMSVEEGFVASMFLKERQSLDVERLQREMTEKVAQAHARLEAGLNGMRPKGGAMTPAEMDAVLDEWEKANRPPA